MSERVKRPVVAVCQEWALTSAGSERVASRLVHALDARHVFLYAADPEVAAELFPGRAITTSRIGRSRFAQRHWRWLIPIMGRWWRGLALNGYDVVVTSSHAVVNDVRVRRPAVHVSYCSTPMRYAWLWRSELDRFPKAIRVFWPLIAAILRRSDRRRARNVDRFIANSREVAQRIESFYGRSASVVAPPIDTAFFTPPADDARRTYFLYAGRLVAYKRPAVVVAAAQLAGVRLVVAGYGPEEAALREMAGGSVEFRVSPSNEELRELYRGARALVFAGVEDFGMVMVEAQACGTPVIAYGRGGALDAVVDGETGVLYDDASVQALAAVLRAFDPSPFDPALIRRHAERFGPERFDEAIRAIVDEVRCGAKA